VPTENLIAPDLVRRLCWDWADAAEPVAAVDEILRAGYARPWQRELVVAALAKAVQPPPEAEAEAEAEADDADG
jgi:ribonuclease D